MILKQQYARFLNHLQKEQKLEAEIIRKQERLSKLKRSQSHSWINTLLKPLARAIAAKEGYKYWEILGPFGMGSETSIWFYNDKQAREDCKVDALTFRPDLDFHSEKEQRNPFGVMIKDYSRKIQAYPKGSIGELNGGNHPSIQPPDDAELDWFINILRKQPK